MRLVLWFYCNSAIQWAILVKNVVNKAYKGPLFGNFAKIEHKESSKKAKNWFQILSNKKTEVGYKQTLQKSGLKLLTSAFMITRSLRTAWTTPRIREKNSSYRSTFPQIALITTVDSVSSKWFRACIILVGSWLWLISLVIWVQWA